MEIWHNLDEVPAGVGPTVVTLGTFDGVHLGHQAVMRRLQSEAELRGARSVVLTFHPHPVRVLFPERAPVPLMRVHDRLAAFRQTGVDATLVLEFTRDFAATTAEDFVRDTLVGKLGMQAIVIGADTRFGHRNAGDVALLQSMGEQLGFDVVVLDDVAAESEDRVSSTAIRAAIAQGDVEMAAAMLSRPHALVGTVVHGDHRGREMGFPTANLAAADLDAVPADGVYAGYLTVAEPPTHPLAGERMPAAISVGTNPTFDGQERRVEAYVIDRADIDLYGAQVRVEFTQFLRATVRFEGMDALLVQMKADVQQCRELLA